MPVTDKIQWGPDDSHYPNEDGESATYDGCHFWLNGFGGWEVLDPQGNTIGQGEEPDPDSCREAAEQAYYTWANLRSPAVPINGRIPRHREMRANGSAVEQWSEWAGFWDLHHHEWDEAGAQRYAENANRQRFGEEHP